MARNKISLYLVSVILFMLLLPVVSILVEWHTSKTPLDWALTGRWFLFWAVGARLFIAGIRQVTKPAFTAKEIFHINGEESYPIIIELGFANISIGLIAMLSIVKTSWCAPAAIAGGLYFGLAGLLHVVRKPANRNELIAMVSDLFIFAIMACYLIFTL